VVVIRCRVPEPGDGGGDNLALRGSDVLERLQALGRHDLLALATAERQLNTREGVPRAAALLPWDEARPLRIFDYHAATNGLHLELTATAPPAAAGAAQLGVPATTAVAGIPATFTPTNSYPPLNLAGAIALPLVASPATNWTSGQYAVMRDGSKINWNGTAWVAGIHA